ncbi:MAG: serine/threonine-protein kinase [Marinicella sp.]
MNKEFDSSDTALWRQAIEICESLSGLEHEEAFARLKQMDLQPVLLEKIHRILSNMSVSNPLLDQHDYQSLMENLKQGSHLVGQNIDGYHITQLIAKGGMSTVYQAYHEDDPEKKTVALKLLSPYGITEKAIELFEREQYILSSLSHPSIVAFHHSGVTTDGTHYMVMEFLEDAENITDYCSHQNFSQSQVVDLVKELCQVFQYAHDQQVIHRDIKPANILMTKDGKAKVIDFGIGRLEVLGGQTVTQVFTPDMAAPEQLLGTAVDNRSDVFTLGALLLQLLTKQKPLPKTNLKSYHPHNDVKHINQVLKNSELHQKLKNIIKTAMHIDPALRYQSMNDFAADLDNWLNHKPINASSDSMFYRIKGFYRRNKAISTLGVVGLLVLLLVSVAIYNIEGQKTKANTQRDSSFALLEAMIDQADPATNEQVVNGDVLVKNLNELANNQAALLSTDPELAHFFYRKLGKLYNNKGLYEQAQSSYEKSFEALTQFKSEDDTEFIDIELTLAHLQETNGQHAAAQRVGEAILSKLEKLPNINPRHRLNVYYLLSKVTQYQSLNELAKSYGEQATAWMLLHPEIDHPLQASMYNSMAVTNRNLGDIKLAEQQYLKAIDLLKPLREKRIELSSIFVNLAILKGRSGDLLESEKYFNESFAVVKSVDENHPHLAINYLPYATLLKVSGRLEESESYIQEAIKILKKHNQSKYLSQAYIKYARFGLYQFRIDLVFENLIKAYPLVSATMGHDHHDMYDIYNMALWVLMSSPYQDYAKHLIKSADNHPHEIASNGSEYQWYLFQKSWLMETSSIQSVPEAIIRDYYQQIFDRPITDRISWLTDQLQTDSHSAFLTFWLELELAHLKDDHEVILTGCSPEQNWMISSYLALKLKIIETCLQHPELLPLETVESFTSISHDFKQPTSKRIDLLNQFINALL